jgi:hypothetical protein
VIPLDALLAVGRDEGAAALGLEVWPVTAVDIAHPSLAGVAEPDLEAALVFGCAADVFVL